MNKNSRFKLYAILVATIVLLVVGSQVIIHWHLNSIDKDGELINDAGKLRMQSQMLVQLSLRLSDDQSIKERLVNELNNFKINQSNVSSKIDQKLRQQDWRIISRSESLAADITEAVEQLLLDPNNQVYLDLILIKEKAFIDAQNATVKAIENYNQQKIKQISIIEYVLAVVTILIILLEVQFIFKPFDRNAQKNTRYIERLLNEQERLVRTVAHDLRNPIGTIMTLVELVKPEVTFKDATMEEMYDLIGYSAVQAQDTIQEILHKESTDYKNISERSIVDIDKLIQKQIKAISVIEGFKNRQIIKVNDTPIEVAINEMKFARVIQNLITNALKFSDREVSISHYTEGKHLVIEVVDKGVGIDMENVSSIFSDKKGTTGLNGEESYGLGLGIVKQIVEDHNGIITVNSKPNEGSTFSIKLPLVVSAA